MTSDGAWGIPSVQLLPASLGKLWADEELPSWVVALGQLPSGARIEDLCKPLALEIEANHFGRLMTYVLNLVRGRIGSIESIRTVETDFFPGLRPEKVPWSQRTERCLQQAGLMDRPSDLCRLTFGDLLRIPGIGIRSAMEFAVMLEIHSRRASDRTGVNSIEMIDENERREELLEQESNDLDRSKKYVLAQDSNQQFLTLDSVPKEQQEDILIDAAIRPWADQISGTDRRFSDLLGFSSVVLFERIEDAVDRDNAAEADALARIIGPLKERIERIESLSLEDALLELFNAVAGDSRDRNRELIRRFGWDGKPPETLQQVGDRLCVTRERVRQIQSRIVRNLPTHSVFLPQLQSAIDVLEEASPIAIEDAAKLLQERGISRRPFHPKSVIVAASNCNISTPLKIRSIRRKKIVTAKTGDKVVRRLASIARAQGGASGATDVLGVLDQAMNEELIFEEERAAKLIRSLPDLQWLTDDWFCVRSVPIERNRLRNVGRKMLSVTSPIHTGKIRAGMRKTVAWRNATWSQRRWPMRAPPEVVVRQFFENHLEFKVDTEGSVYPAEELDYRNELGATERHMVDAIRSTPAGVLDRQSIRDSCIRKGVNPHTLEVNLTYSPVIEHLGVNLWAIAGAYVDPAAVEAVRKANALRPREKRISDFGWTDKGEIWISVIVPSYHTSSFVFGVPGGVKRFLVGERFRARDDLGRTYGDVVVNPEGTAYGAGPLLLRKGADSGDIALFRFDLTENIVTISVGGEELSEA